MNIHEAQVVLEELLTTAIEGARDAKETADRDEFADGKRMAHYDIITTAKESAELMGITFADKTLAAFNPDKELLGSKKRAA